MQLQHFASVKDQAGRFAEIDVHQRYVMEDRSIEVVRRGNAIWARP